MRKVINLGLNTKSVRGVHPAYSAYSLYKARVEADGGYIQNELKTRDDFATPGGGTRRYVAYAGIKTSLFEGRVVVDKVYDLHGVADQVFAGLDRPELLTWQTEQASWGVEKTSENKLLDSRDLTTVNWLSDGSPTVTRDQIGVDGVDNKACLVTDDDGSIAEAKKQAVTIVSDGNTHQCSTYVKKTTGATTFPRFDARLAGGTASSYVTYINTNNGTLGFDGVASSSNVVIKDKGDFWKVICNVTNNSSGNTALTIYIYPAATTDLSSTVGSLTGTSVVDQFQVELNTSYPLAPIITGATTVTRTAPAPVLDGFLLVPDSDTKWSAGVVNMVRDNSQAQFIYDNNLGSARSQLYISTAGNIICVNFGSASGFIEKTMPISMTVNERFNFGFVNFYSDSSQTLCLFDEVGNIYKYTGTHAINGASDQDINLGFDNVGARHSSLYYSSIASGDDAYSDDKMIEIAKKMTKGDSRFDGAVWAIQP